MAQAPIAKAFSRALELYSAKDYAAALAAALAEARARNLFTSPLFQRLVDEICMHAAATGQVIGFDGRLLQVHPANSTTAWLGVGVSEPPQTPGGGADASSVQQQFSSLQDALEAAADGDVVQLLPGTHVVSQVMLHVSKRVMITSTPGCSAQQVVLDHRANHPCFRIDRSCVLRGFTIDMVGFCEAVAIAGSSTTVKPILQDLVLMCSGDDGISVRDKAQPLLRGCEIRVRGCGLRQADASSTTLWQCTIAGGKHALIAAGTSQTFFEGCTLCECSQECVLGLQEARVSLTDTRVSGCQGPGVDMSDSSSLVLKQADVVNNEGGVWLWGKSSCEAISSHITGGSTYAVLLDAEAYARGSSCSIDGACHVQSMPGEEGPDEQPELDEQGSDVSNASNATLAAAASARGQRLSREGIKAAAARAANNNDAAAAAAATRHQAAAGAPAMLLRRDPGGPFGAGSPAASAASPFGSSNGSSQACLTELDLCGGGGGGSSDDLVRASMLVRDASAAAALFPAAVGAFAAPPQGPAYMQF